tara:strand:+ start:5251 stop:6390 length:1140 start_codon:yes stop_codon:yes gene_type:complete
VLFVTLLPSVLSEDLVGDIYKIKSPTTSSGTDDLNSATYKSSATSGVAAETVNSDNYKIQTGFFQNILLVSGQPCSSDGQCESGFCCSSVCSATACPAVTTTTTVASAGAAPSGDSGGGGVGVSTRRAKETISNFTLSPEIIDLTLNLGDRVIENIVLENNGTVNLSISTVVSGVNEFITLSDAVFELIDTKEVQAEILARKLGSYFGEILFSSDVSKVVQVILNIESETTLFDVNLDIPSEFKTIMVGEDVKVQVSIFDIGQQRSDTVNVIYKVKDKQGNVIYQFSEFVDVENQISFSKVFDLPKDIESDEYLASVEVESGDSLAVSSDVFTVISAPIKIRERLTEFTLKNLVYFIAIILFIFALAVYIINRRSKFRV